MMIFGNQSGQDVNALRELMRRGLLKESDLANLAVSESERAPNALAQMMSPLESATAGQGFQGLSSGQGVVQATNPDGTQGAPIRIDSGPPVAQGAPRDWSRVEVDTPNGRGYYGKDGKIYTPDGAVTTMQPVGTQARRNAEQDRLMKIAEMQARLANVQEQTASSQASRARKESPSLEALPGAGISQDILEKQYGKPDKGRRWKIDGTQENLPGGVEQDKMQTALDSGRLAIDNIDELIGKRDAKGNLIPKAEPHPGFEGAVGVSFQKLLPDFALKGTDTMDFRKRLDQLKGGAFLQAYETLKGTGQITEIEGKKATDAITRMDEAQSEKEFVTAAREFRSVIDAAMRSKVGQTTQSGGNTVRLPDGRTKTFPNAASADAFKKAAGL